MNEHDVKRLLGDISPRAAAVTLLLLDRVLARYRAIHGVTLSEADRQSIAEALRILARQDADEYESSEESARPRDLEAELHELDREIYRLLQQMNGLRRGATPSPETQAKLAELEHQYEIMSARFVDLYRPWSQQP